MLSASELPQECYAAQLPNEVVKPYVKEVYNCFRIQKQNTDYSTFPGISQMEKTLGVSQKMLSNILLDKSRGISIEVCDKIAMFGDFSLDEMFEQTVEWAIENPDRDWPYSYLRYKNGRQKKGFKR